jgi:hypothetical protein
MLAIVETCYVNGQRVTLAPFALLVPLWLAIPRRIPPGTVAAAVLGRRNLCGRRYLFSSM